MSYIVVACDECKVLLFDPEVKTVKIPFSSNTHFPGINYSDYYEETKVDCPVCKMTTNCTQINDLSDD